MEEKLRPRIQKKRKDQNTHMGKNAKQETKHNSQENTNGVTEHLSLLFILLSLLVWHAEVA